MRVHEHRSRRATRPDLFEYASIDHLRIAAPAEGRPLLKLRLVAPPVEGAANDALIAYLAKALSLRKADIAIRSGETSRVKILHLAGDSRAILERLDVWLSA